MYKNSYEKGIQSEQKALSFLKKNNYVILAQRYRTPVGEIDIIAFKEFTLHIIEVKERPTLYQARESISERQKKRINYATELFLKEREKILNFLDIQMDAILLARNQLCYLERAWIPDESLSL